MARWAPCKREVFIKKLHQLGFTMPAPGGHHFYMRYGSYSLTIPNNSEFSVPQVKMLIKQVESALHRKVLLNEWLKL